MKKIYTSEVGRVHDLIILYLVLIISFAGIGAAIRQSYWSDRVSEIRDNLAVFNIQNEKFVSKQDDINAGLYHTDIQFLRQAYEMYLPLVTSTPSYADIGTLSDKKINSFQDYASATEFNVVQDTNNYLQGGLKEEIKSERAYQFWSATSISLQIANAFFVFLATFLLKRRDRQ